MPSDQEPLLPPPVTSGSSLGTSPSSPNTLRSKLARRASGQSHYPTTSSDRSKGKQKAEDQDEIEAQRSYPFPRPSSPESPSTPQGTGRPVNVIFSGEGAEGGGNLEIWIEEGQSVGSVKDQIRHLRPALSESSLRLIHSGRLLTDGILLLPWLRSLEERVKRQAGGVGGDVESVLKEVGLTEDTKDHGTGRDKEATPGSSPLGISRSHRKSKQLPSDKVFLHCNVGSKEDKSATPQDDVEEPTAPRRRGFDVLLDAGLSAAEVAQMRRQFYESRGEEVPEGMDLGDQNDEHARALEEQWIEGDLTADTAETTTEGMYTSILNGLLTGFLFPILPFFYFRDSPLPNFADADVEADSQDYDEEAADRDRAGDEASARVANTHGIGGEMVEAVVFGKRMQMGILLGTLINVAFGALRFMN